MDIVNISTHTLDQATDTLFLAFANDPLLLWMFDGKENYLKNGRWTFNTWIKWTMRYGIAIATPNCEAVALRKKPGKHHFSLWGLWRSGMLKTRAVLGPTAFNKIQVIDSLFKTAQRKNMGSDLFWYCWLIGTHPHHQRRGFGKALMNYTFDLANASQLPCYLETATEDNVRIHSKQGYCVNSSFEVPSSEIKIYSMSKVC